MSGADETAEPRHARSAAIPSDVLTVDGIVKALYQSVSFSPGTQPDYSRFRSLFHSEARFVLPKGGKESRLQVVDVDAVISRSREDVVLGGLERKGFIETEITRRVHSFGSIVHIFSTFEAKHAISDPTPMHRGIKSIQLMREHHRWWIVSLMWEIEQQGNPIPKAYLV